MAAGAYQNGMFVVGVAKGGVEEGVERAGRQPDHRARRVRSSPGPRPPATRWWSPRSTSTPATATSRPSSTSSATAARDVRPDHRPPRPAGLRLTRSSHGPKSPVPPRRSASPRLDESLVKEHQAARVAGGRGHASRGRGGPIVHLGRAAHPPVVTILILACPKVASAGTWVALVGVLAPGFRDAPTEDVRERDPSAVSPRGRLSNVVERIARDEHRRRGGNRNPELARQDERLGLRSAPSSVNGCSTRSLAHVRFSVLPAPYEPTTALKVTAR